MTKGKETLLVGILLPVALMSDIASLIRKRSHCGNVPSALELKTLDTTEFGHSVPAVCVALVVGASASGIAECLMT